MEDLDLILVPNTSSDVRDKREAIAQTIVEIIKSLARECKLISDHNAHTFEWLTKDSKLKALDSQLQEEKQQAATVKVQLKLQSPVERMKRDQE